MSHEHQASTSSQSDSPKGLSTRAQVVIAAAVLGLLGLGVGLFSILAASNAQDSGNRTAVSAAEWVGAGEGSKSESIAPSGDSARVDKHAPSKYAHSSTDLLSSEGDPSTGGARMPEGVVVAGGTIQKGTAVMTTLTRVGLTNGQAHSVISALDGKFDFRKARPGHSFEVHTDKETGEPTYFRYDASLVDVYEVKRQGGRLVGKKKHIPTERKIRRFGGTIASSLYKALVEMDAHPSLTGKVVEVFAHDVKFFKAQRPGDTFRVIVEEESLNGEFLGYGPVQALEYNGTKSGKKQLFRFQAGDNQPTYYDPKGISVPRSVIVIPLHYTRMSSPFGMRFHPVLRRRIKHTGVDFSAPHGTPIWACRAGTVTFAGRKGANGNLVIIHHDENLQSVYAHLQRFASAAKKGAKVRERQVIGYVGSTGRSTGPHLHFGLKKNGRFIDPLKYKVQPGKPVPAKYRSKLKSLIAEKGNALKNIPIRQATAPLEEIDEDEVLGLEDLGLEDL